MIPSFPSYIFIDDTTIQRVTQNNVLRSEMSIGAQKTRPRQSVPMFQVSFAISMLSTNLTNWREWFIEDIASGAYWFLLNDPLDGTKRRFRFVEYEINWLKSGNLLRSQIVLESYDAL